MGLLKKNLLLIFCLWGLILSAGAKSFQRKICFDKGWYFHLGAVKNAEEKEFDDSQWRKLDLPHDWSIEPIVYQEQGEVVGPFYRESVGGSATGQTVGGEGWYRKKFTLKPEEENKRHILYFEGAYAQSQVWVNGQKVYFNPYGYISFRCDISKYCLPAGQENVIAVRVINEGKNTRWYAGSGIYRHVWFIQTESAYLDEWSTAIVTQNLTGKEAGLAIRTTVFDESIPSSKEVKVQLLSPQGKKVAEQQLLLPHVAHSEDAVFNLQINDPQVWSTETPVLYTAKISLWKGKQQLDELAVPFGIRTISFSAEEGFLLNGKSLKLKGGCVHHDHGLLGAVSYDRAEERKVELLKANGFNAVRCSHNLPAEHFLTACDRMGLLVIDEVFDQWQKPKNPQDNHRFFDDWSNRDVQTMVLRDRSHPSVIMWSIGNEIQERADSVGMEIAKRLRKCILQYDSTRPITAAINEFWDNRHLKWDDSERAFRHLDVGGYNYMWKEYESDHRKHPHRVIYGSESVPKEAAQNWDLVEKLPYVIGDFVWTAIDYLGEAGIAHSLVLDPKAHNPQFMGWPWYNGWCGDIDLCGHKKPQSYYRDVIWNREKITMAVEPPLAKGKVQKISYWGWQNESLSWTFPGLENEVMTVNVYTRAPRVRLYLNDTIIGESTTSKTYTAVFHLPYQPGCLRAVELLGTKEGAATVLETTGEPVAIRLSVDRDRIQADGDLAYVLVELIDGQGRVVSDNARKIRIQCSGAGAVIASGNASPCDMQSFRSLTPAFYEGRAMAILKATEKPGAIKLRVSSVGLGEAVLKVKTY